MWRKMEPHTEDTKDTEDRTMVPNLQADPPPCCASHSEAATEEEQLALQLNALVVLVEGDCELTESFHADISDVAEGGIDDGGLREFVVAELDQVLELDLFYLHVAGGAAR